MAKIKASKFFEGVGIHSGERCRVTVGPCLEKGIFFCLPGGIFPVSSARTDGASRGTSLVFPDGSRVMTVEHLLASLAGLGIWSALISVSGPEIPAMDGSARVFYESLSEVALPGESTRPIEIVREISFGDADGGGFMAVIPSEAFEVACVISYEAKGIGCQVFEGKVTPELFRNQIAPARTFVLSSEIRAIRERGLGKGGDIDNVLVIDDGKPPAQESQRVPDEPVRHKVLDLIGDLALLGAPVRGRVIAYRSGHRLHLELVRRIRRSLLPA